MWSTLPSAAPPLRILGRKCLTPRSDFPVQPGRPSFFDGRVAGDAWIAWPRDQVLSLRFNQMVVARIAGTSLDQASLNELLFWLRHRRPRQRARSA